ncbi:MAG: hypothetical protein AAFQ90_05445, partial [Pseudomonadota bacterium]
MRHSQGCEELKGGGGRSEPVVEGGIEEQKSEQNRQKSYGDSDQGNMRKFPVAEPIAYLNQMLRRMKGAKIKSEPQNGRQRDQT